MNNAETVDVGKYGLLWIEYIRETYPEHYRSLVRFGVLEYKAADVNEVAYMLLNDVEEGWLSKHKPKDRNSFVEIYQLRTQARLIAEEKVLHEVIRQFY